MAKDRLFIEGKIRTFVREEKARFWTSSEIHVGINDGFRQIAEDINYPKADYSGYIASGAYTFSMSSDFIKIDPDSEVIWKDGSGTNVLTPARLKDIGRHTMLTATPGTPQNYFFIKENQLGIYPPSTSGCIVVPIIAEPTHLSSDTDTNELTEQCYMADAYWVAWEAFHKDKDPRTASYNALYNNEINRIKGRFGDMWEIEYQMTPHEDYLK